jgi:hypothetical protein
MPNSSGSLVIAIKPKAEQKYSTGAMLLFNILQMKNLTNVAYFAKINNHP